MATASLNRKAVTRWWQLTSAQVLWLSFQAALLAGLTCWQFVLRPEVRQAFWSDPVGIQLTVWAVLLTVLNFAALVGGCLALHRLDASFIEEYAALRKVFLGVLYGGCLTCFYLPALFIVLLGPAAVSIRHALLIS